MYVCTHAVCMYVHIHSLLILLRSLLLLCGSLLLLYWCLLLWTSWSIQPHLESLSLQAFSFSVTSRDSRKSLNSGSYWMCPFFLDVKNVFLCCWAFDWGLRIHGQRTQTYHLRIQNKVYRLCLCVHTSQKSILGRSLEFGHLTFLVTMLFKVFAVTRR